MTTSTPPRAPATLAALPRSVATRRVNRTSLTLLGLILAATGVLTLLVGLAVFGRPLADGPVLVPQASRFAADAGWFWPVVAAAGVVLALLALRWLIIQLRSNRTRDIDIESERSRGETVLSPAAVTAAVDTEISSYHGVDSAASSLRDHQGRMLLLVKVRLDGRGGVAEVRDAIESRAVANARQALDKPDLAARVEITVSPRRVRRTR
jgi:hypothetical protein